MLQISQISKLLRKRQIITAICKRNCYRNDDNSSNSHSTNADKLSGIELPPAPTNCCMSGCPNCVWIEYAEEIGQLFKDSGGSAKQYIMDQIEDPNMRAFLSMELRNLENRKINNNDKSD